MNAHFLRNVFIKGLLIFLVFNLAFAALPPKLGKLSLYNHLLSGRERLPFGEDSSKSYNLSLLDLDAMFAAHILTAGEKTPDEYRVIALGDSSVWGTLLRPQETLAGQLNAAALTVCGRRVRVYNLGYPTISLTKDLMILEQARRYQPDSILWGLTLEAFPLEKQVDSPLVANNPARVDELIARYALPLSPADPALVRPNFWARTLIGQRRALADLLRLQLYGVLWSATGIDQIYPTDYAPAQTDFDSESTYHGQSGAPLEASRLAWSMLQAGIKAAAPTPLILFNEPMLISAGKNSGLRYNFFYPRWAYDQWRAQMAQQAQANAWNYLDLWNLVPPTQFTNSAIHLTPNGEHLLATQLGHIIQEQPCP
ncbi:MAG: hypothetical protein CO094_03585 [Anaerolineae bacterium CG_4_9_14_3_um_filter_57_17]|nr:hypothetical protein [bacterium]NCT19562.1 hypothetical protein [bacterium]OIO85144.1 MAG: hypothetical protein AUK01_06950 [Anaerolineae bacterium CG2_30_57_67]PJB67625.1 MAG: hypothetical protein CO094_03585 [Anaerolineae bacterium CG_4_9_14_3_um_filter_57_17]